MYDRRLMMLLATLGATVGVATYAATVDAVVVDNDGVMTPMATGRERYGTPSPADMAGARCARTAPNLRSKRAQSPLTYRAARPRRRPQ